MTVSAKIGLGMNIEAVSNIRACPKCFDLRLDSCDFAYCVTN